MRNLFKTKNISIIAWISLGLLWFVLSRAKVLNSAFFSSPEDIISNFGQAEFWQVFSTDLMATVSRLITSLVLGFVLSYCFIFVSLFVPKLQDFIRQFNQLLKYVPVPVIIPISILLFGTSDLSKIFIATFTVFTIYLNYLLNVLDKEESQYKNLQTSWEINKITRFKEFFWPISNYLNYRIITTLISWSLSIVLISEIILGGAQGLGIRILQLQQLYKTSTLYGYLVLILVFTFLLEKIFLNFFARFKWDIVKFINFALIVFLILFSFIYQAGPLVQNIGEKRLSILSYKAVINLPVLVYIEKYNELNLKLEMSSSGLQVMDILQSEKGFIGGYSDMPNVLAGQLKNKQLKILSQVVEKPDYPTLFLISSRELKQGNYSAINNSKIGYYPNNPIIQKGLDAVLFSNKTNTSSVEFVNSNDPLVLSQALTAGQIQSLLSIEPYITEVEQKMGIKRINPSTTAVSGIKFESLPLAGMVVNTQKLDKNQISSIEQGMKKSIDFIRENTDEAHKAKPELKKIMQKYDLNPDSNLSAFETEDEIDPKNLGILLKLLSYYQIEGFEDSVNNENEFYYNYSTNN